LRIGGGGGVNEGAGSVAFFFQVGAGELADELVEASLIDGAHVFESLLEVLGGVDAVVDRGIPADDARRSRN